jgi:hypothetical protein
MIRKIAQVQGNRSLLLQGAAQFVRHILSILHKEVERRKEEPVTTPSMVVQLEDTEERKYKLRLIIIQNF